MKRPEGCTPKLLETRESREVSSSKSQQPDESKLVSHILRPAYHLIRASFRKVRAARNYFLNIFDSPVIILIYHRVTELEADPEMLAVSPDNFRRQMEFLKQQFRIVRFDKDWSDLKERAVAITFDDGYADNVLEALPILEEVGVPATFFVSTGRIGSDNEFWWHQLEGILLRDGEYPPRFKLNDSRYGREWDTNTLQQRKKLYDSLNELMLNISPDRQEVWLDQLRKWSGLDKAAGTFHRSMTREELKKLAANPWAVIGAHTVTHSALSALTEEQQRKEILPSKQALENITGTKITTFSYPFGRKRDYNNTSVRLCREAGFDKAASNFPGQVHRWTDQYQLPRHLVRNWDLETFAAKMESFWTR
jgi:peptidoglycan/xylan/chitin deacetylase (PgdA/CDA1 family)